VWGVAMAKLKQHYMLKGKNDCHPVFKFIYLPENIASFAETVALFSISILIIAFLSGMIIVLLNIYTSGNALLFIYSSLVGSLASLFGMSNSINGYFILTALSVAAFYLVRKYFEFVKYNLHVLRERLHSELNREKSQKDS